MTQAEAKLGVRTVTGLFGSSKLPGGSGAKARVSAQPEKKGGSADGGLAPSPLAFPRERVTQEEANEIFKG